MLTDDFVPPLLVFGMIQPFKHPNKGYLSQTERLNALTIARYEIETVVAETRIKGALKSKPARPKHLINPEHQVRVFRENAGNWKGHFTVTKTLSRTISITDVNSTREFNITSVLPIAPYTNNPDVKLV